MAPPPSPPGVKTVPRSRLAGLDILRILCAYGVVALHSGLSQDFHLSRAAATYQLCFDFAVPAFLAISFYLQASRDPNRPFSLLARSKRILVPYFVWSAVHLAARIVKDMLQHQPARVREVLDDPVALVFFGSTSVQLYFLPLVLIGGCLCAALHRPLAKMPLLWLWFLLFAGWLVYHLLLVTDNAFDLTREMAFSRWAPALKSVGSLQQPMRILLAYLSWGIRCFPYVVGVFLVARLYQTRILKISAPLLAAAALYALFFPAPVGIIPAGADELLIGLGFLAAFLSISSLVPCSAGLTRVATFTFGIFLVHDLVLECFDILLHRRGAMNISLPGIVAISLFAFAFSALLVWVGSKSKFGRTVFAVA